MNVSTECTAPCVQYVVEPDDGYPNPLDVTHPVDVVANTMVVRSGLYSSCWAV